MEEWNDVAATARSFFHDSTIPSFQSYDPTSEGWNLKPDTRNLLLTTGD
jgi:hypothetical protein